uniref:Uncharacterized protein n=1 Tax=Noctiluca scintillans TaxID=2966 RepID=A0A7S1AYJ4_NOCSC|mmetsp:Transcript_65275/g.173078  ORF Transcript_65275/g.173078 Transcript_65275/m.173078 type:complete len:473 (+) Transcript_65275:74-1492(+)|eukprot:CAMPEP_0194532028 /NCGR_PEP_ID=MMETSP0253-20130528/69466_1 /TAXON_ID=2966 /ORGANISM="Noctiluca scintillans" /LENGTH=472 /DNA_ID=CAMNT_0039377427 /DNA_START=11 /DNA_END=1429 /DNA_ORIENTATION=+
MTTLAASGLIMMEANTASLRPVSSVSMASGLPGSSVPFPVERRAHSSGRAGPFANALTGAHPAQRTMDTTRYPSAKQGRLKDMYVLDEGPHAYMSPRHLSQRIESPPKRDHATEPFWKAMSRSKFPNSVRAYQDAAAAGEISKRFGEGLRHHGYRGEPLHVDSLLLDRPDAVNKPVNFEGGSTLHIASMKGHADLARLLIHRGADVNCTNRSKQTSLHAACDMNQGSVVFELLCAGADADQRDFARQSPLHRAAFAGAEDAVQALLDYGASAKLKDESGGLPIHKAATMGRAGVIQMLLQRDHSSVGARAEQGWTPLHFAAHGGHQLACEVLVSYGADVNAADDMEMRPLHRAAVSGNPEVCNFLARSGGDLAATDVMGNTPMHTACEEGHAMATRSMLQMGADPAALDGLSRTALHVSTEGRHAEICESLLDFGADANHTNVTKGVPSPLSVARRRHPRLVELLQSGVIED